MKQLEKYLSNAFVAFSIYLLVTILGGFFILPNTFHGDNIFLTFITVFLPFTSIIAAIAVVCLAIIILIFEFNHKTHSGLKRPTSIAAISLFGGIIFIFLHAIYVKLRTCPAGGNDAWYCQVEGKSYIGMLVLVFFLSSLAGCAVWIAQKLTKKK